MNPDLVTSNMPARRLLSGLAISLFLLACAGDSGSDDDAGRGATADASGGGSDGDDAGGSSGTGNQDAGGNQGGGNAGGTDAGLDGGTSGRDASTPRDAATASDANASTDSAVKTDGGSAGDAGASARFSFFVISQVAIVELSKNPKGFGGDLRYGETGDGAGLRGADKICTEVAERSMPGAGAKKWRAFLSASTGGASGGAVNARDRIGGGPWYDRKGRLVGNALADLISGDRPSMADQTIRDDLPNETGTGNRAPDGTAVDNHDTLTGSDTAGRYVSGSNTCLDWTSSSTSTGGGGGGAGGSGPAIGHSWPRSANNGRNWVSDHRAGGCGQGINTSNGSSDGTPTVGSGGGYGQFYCFALEP